MAKTKVGKALSKLGSWSKKNVVPLAIGAAAVAAPFIPGVGNAIGNGISKIGQKITGIHGKRSIPETVTGVVPERDGKGGLFGTGLFAGIQDRLENAAEKKDKLEAKVIEKANKLLGTEFSSIDDAKKAMGGSISVLEGEASDEISKTPKGASKPLSPLALGAGALALYFLFGRK